VSIAQLHNNYNIGNTNSGAIAASSSQSYFLRSMMNNKNDTIRHPTGVRMISYYGDGEYSFVPSFVRELTTTFLGVLYRMSSYFYKNQEDSSSVLTTANAAKYNYAQRIEDDYVFLFYLLLGINCLAIFPSWCRRLFFFFFRRRGSSGSGSGSSANSRKNQEQQQEEEEEEQFVVKSKKQQDDAKYSLIHGKLLQTYLPAYLFATCADWLQGPYKYALYSSYGYTQKDIAHLFVAGYGSGMVLGSIVGGLADTYGRKKLCLFYCASYTFSVLMKHCKHFHVLLLGRVGGGVATSLLFSVFESWLIGAHGECGLLVGGGGSSSEEEGSEEKWLAKSLSLSMYGSSLVAIGSGVLANVVVENSGKMRPWNSEESNIYVGGYISAFDACLVPLGLCAVLITVLWEENYGEEKAAAATTAADASKKSGAKEEVLAISDGQSVNCLLRRYNKDAYMKKHSDLILENDKGTEQEDMQQQHNGMITTIENNEEYIVLLKEEKKGGHNLLRRQSPAPQLQQQQNNKEGPFSALIGGMRTVWNSTNIFVCCIIGSIFEGAMYIFIFLWTPALTSLQDKIDAMHDDNDDDGKLYSEMGDVFGSTTTDSSTTTPKDAHTDSELPFGWIFSTFMVCCMLGTMAFSRLSNAGVPASKCLAGVLALASLSCVMMACPFSEKASSGGISSSSSANTPQYIGMLMYEFCIGFYYPAMGTVKGSIVPEDQRAAIYNVFRLPLNLLVLVYLVGDFGTEISFLANAVLLMVTCALQIWIVRGGGSRVSSSHGSDPSSGNSVISSDSGHIHNS